MKTLQNNKMLSGKNVIITGTTSSIGKEIALAMSKAGANILIHYCSNEKSAQTLATSVEKLGTRIRDKKKT